MFYRYIYLMECFLEETFDGEYYTSKFRHTSSLKSLESLNQTQFHLVLSLSKSAVESLHDSVNTLQYNDMLQKEINRHKELFNSEKLRLEEEFKHKNLTSQNDLEALKIAHKTKISEIDRDLKLARSELGISEFAMNKMREQFDSLKKHSEDLLKVSLKEVVAKQEEQHQKEILQIQAMNKTMRESIESQARERVTQCDNQHKEATEKMRSLYIEQELKLRKELEKTFNSSEKGKQGEQEFEDIVKQYVSWPPLVNMSKTSHGTDRSCRIRKCDTLFEIKNYSSEVPSKEVEKFQRDMEEKQDYPMGVFISMNTGIVGKKSGNFITVEWTSKSQLLLYVNSFYHHSSQDTLAFIDMCADIAWVVYKEAREEPDTCENTIQLQSKIENIKVYVDNELKRMAEFLRMLNHDKITMIDTITKQNTTYTYHIKQSKQALQSMIEIILGKVEDDVETPEVVEDTSKLKKRSKKSTAVKSP